MNYLTHQLLDSEELEILRKNLDKEEFFWEDGKRTAGKQAAMVKNNLQLRRDSDLSIKFSRLITKKILSNEIIKSFSLPKKVHGTIFSKTTIGMKLNLKCIEFLEILLLTGRQISQVKTTSYCLQRED